MDLLFEHASLRQLWCITQEVSGLFFVQNDMHPFDRKNKNQFENGVHVGYMYFSISMDFSCLLNCLQKFAPLLAIDETKAFSFRGLPYDPPTRGSLPTPLEAPTQPPLYWLTLAMHISRNWDPAH